MVFRWNWVLLLVVLGVTCPVAMAVDSAHPRVPGFERFYASPLPAPSDEDEEPIHLDPITGGRILLTELNCVSCHSATLDAKTRLIAKQAPVLDEIGSRVKVEWLRAYLSNPHEVKPRTTMPDLIATIPEEARSLTVEALTHFLASSGKVPDGRPDPVAAGKGAALFQTVGCLACHNSLDENSPTLATSAPLPDLGKKYTATSLMAFLKDPLKSRPSGRMPSLGLSDEDYRNLAFHFVRDGEVAPTVKFALFHGSWQKVPNFAELKPVVEGESAGFDVAIANRASDFAIRFTTYLRIVKDGRYRFSLGSDDGSKLFIDDELVVDCDGIHPHETKEGHAILKSGFHKVIVDYFQGGGEATLEANISGPGLPRQSLAGMTFLEPKIPVVAASPDKPVFTLDASLVSKGQTLFSSIGCASCHQMAVPGTTMVSELKAKPVSELVANNGCLAEQVAGKAPRYGLSAIQRASLQAAINAASDETEAETIHRSMATLNCYACHQRGKLGGVEPARNDSFASLQKEMGDEGRLPPVLTGVGDKLRPDWLRHLLHHGADDRKNYMVTKMPKFGPNNVNALADLFERVDTVPTAMPKAEFHEPEYRVKAAGRHLVGGQALSCIKCHDFGPHPSTGVRAINLTTMTQRLRADWFYRYVLDPQVYRRGTRMPAPWPSGQATIRDTLNADVNLQVQAVWSFLSDGDRASVPVGLIREPIELKPQAEPIIYRNFIEGAGSRAIGVGYPEGVNIAFDANNLRLALIWHGAFIDAARHWTGRGVGFESPLGDDVLPLPSHAPFLKLDKPDREFPSDVGRDAGYKFLGYFLDPQQRPVFRYSTSGLIVEDHLVPRKGSGKFATLDRTLQFEGTADTNQLWYRAATGQILNDLGDGRYRIDDVWTMEIRAAGADKPIVRESGGKKELLVPIRLMNGKGEIFQHYVW